MYNLLRKIIDFCYKDKIEKDQLIIFKSNVNQFLSLYRISIKDYNKSFTDKKNQIKFTFKLHHLYHYPELIERFGPLKHSSTIRGERFHQLHKYAISASKSRINIPLQIVNNWSILFLF